MTRMAAPSSGVTVRMYRHGHGDCFLLAFAGRDGGSDRPVYFLIDCGLKGGSQINKVPIDKVIKDIGEATDYCIDVLVMTHEHEDHVNGFGKKDKKGNRLFEPFTIKEVWLAWTEDGDDDGANALRDTFNDKLFLLARGVSRLKGYAAAKPSVDRIMAMLETDTGEDADGLDALLEELNEIGAAPDLDTATGNALAIGDVRAEGLAAKRKKRSKGSTNKNAMKYMRDKAPGRIKFLDPEKPPHSVDDLSNLKVYALGPPRDPKLLTNLEPEKHEEFGFGKRVAVAETTGVRSLRSSLEMTEGDQAAVKGDPPFPARYVIPDGAVMSGGRKENSYDEHIVNHREKLHAAMQVGRKVTRAREEAVRKSKPTPLEYLRSTYGVRTADDARAEEDRDGWRRIDESWLNPLEALALRLNDEVNNTSLVLAFELPNTKKVLLFTGDAQRGNWISWASLKWRVARKWIHARELLSRCVFYKVGHHGSHNATLKGEVDDDWPNLGWLGHEDADDEFVAMIPAHTAWAEKRYRWEHPMKEIEEALEEKAKGRVIRSDKPDIGKLPDLTRAERAAFKKRYNASPLYFEYTVLD